MDILGKADDFMRRHGGKVLAAVPIGLAATAGLACLPPATMTAAAGALGVSSTALTLAPMAAPFFAGLAAGAVSIARDWRDKGYDYVSLTMRAAAAAPTIGAWRETVHYRELRKEIDRQDALATGCKEQDVSRHVFLEDRTGVETREEVTRDRSTERDFLP